jgi:uncharacterized protein YegP (UPF0339 family)
MAYYHLVRSGTQYMFNLKGNNHERVLTSERYTTKASALSGIESVKANAPQDARYKKKTNSKGEPYFTLVAANGETLGTSESYSSESARDSGISWVKANAPSASTKDEA